MFKLMGKKLITISRLTGPMGVQVCAYHLLWQSIGINIAWIILFISMSTINSISDFYGIENIITKLTGKKFFFCGINFLTAFSL